MSEAERYRDVVGEILYVDDAGSDPVTTIIYNADGSIDAGGSFLDEDPDFMDEPWTEAEIEANAAASGAGADKASGSGKADEIDEEEQRLSEFRDDDAGYLAWLAAHPNGYVINIARNYKTIDARTHRSSCRTINGQKQPRATLTGPYVKVCADNLWELDRWAIWGVGELVVSCGICQPAAGREVQSTTTTTETTTNEPDSRFIIVGPTLVKLQEVQAWTDDYVPFERRTGWQKHLRDEIRRRCRQLRPMPDQLLHATFAGEKLRGADVENLTIYNIDSFREAGRYGIRFELCEKAPQAPDGHDYRFGYRYALEPRSGFFTHWKRGRTLASFDWTDLGEFAGEKKLAQVWLAIARTRMQLSTSASPGKPFAVRVEVRPPHGLQPVWGGLVRQVLDGVICALQFHTETPLLREVKERLANQLGIGADEIERLLCEPRRAVLGEVPRLVSPYRSGVKWNPSDHLCVAGELRAAEPEPGQDRWSIKGQVFRVLRSDGLISRINQGETL